MTPKSGSGRPKTAHTSSFNVITYYRGDYKNRHGKCPVYLYIYLCGKRVKINTGVYVEPNHWDPLKLCVKKSDENQKDLNLIIKNCKAQLNDIFVRYRLQHKALTPDILVNEYKRPSLTVDFLEFMDSAIQERKGELEESSLKQHRAHMNKLKEFRSRVYFSDLNEEFFAAYHRWLKTKKSNSQNTRFNSLKTIRTYINIAKRKGLISENALNVMPVRRSIPEREFLTESELARLVALYRNEYFPESHHKVLRHYLFCCFTGIRISDLFRLKMEEIIGDTMVIMPHKTRNVNGMVIKVPLNKMAKQLIKDEAPFRLKGNIFKTFSEPRTRLFLKEILPVAKVNRKLSFHSSRHTFATIFLKKTKNVAALQKILGHTRIEQTMIYAHLLQEDLDNEMRAMDSF